MKVPLALLTCFLLLFNMVSYAQLYEMESGHNVDLSTKYTKMENVHFTIDSTKMSLKSGDHNYYYDAKSFMMDENGVINMVVLDLNDNEVMIKFSPSAKVLDYYLQDMGIRYYLDKVTMPKPDVKKDSASMKKDSSGEEEAKEDTTIYETADVMPEYQGGKQAMMDYISKNEKIPSKAKKDGTKGFVQLDAVIEKDGSIKYIKVTKDIGDGCGDEATRLIKAMPKWSAGENKDEPVRVNIPLTISFLPMK